MPEQVLVSGTVTGSTTAPEVKNFLTGEWMPVTTFNASTGKYTCLLTGIPGRDYPATTFYAQIPGTTPLVTGSRTVAAFTVLAAPAPTPTPTPTTGDGSDPVTYTAFESGANTLDAYELQFIN